MTGAFVMICNQGLKLLFLPERKYQIKLFEL